MIPDHRGRQSKYWVFTLKNYTEADITRLSQPITGVNYLAFGKGIGSKGTPHLQGIICFQNRKRYGRVNEVVGWGKPCWITTTRYIRKTIIYCMEKEDFTEIGDLDLVRCRDFI